MVKRYRTADGGILVYRTDITELKLAEQALAESEERFKDFAESASDWYWEMDDQLRFTYFSDRFEEITGVPADELLGKTRGESGLPLEDNELNKNLSDLEAHRPFKDFDHYRILRWKRRLFVDIRHSDL